LPLQEDFLLVDGYNIIHAWDELRELMEDVSLESARVKLIDTLSNYKGVQKLDSVEQWRSYGFWGKLKFYYVNNGLKQTIRYAIQKMIGRAK